MNNELISIFPSGTGINSKGHLEIGGCDTVDLAQKYGTPLYILDENHIRSKCREFKEKFGSCYPHTRVAYASKACLNKALVRIIDQEGLDLDVVSGGELFIALSAGFPAGRIYFHGNNKSRQELQAAFDNRVGHIVADNLMELEVLHELVGQHGYCPEILLRVAPGVEAHTHHHIITGYTGSKFGLPLDEAPLAIRQAMNMSGLKLTGLHCHLGSQIHETRPYEEALHVLISFSRSMREQTGFELRQLSIGGGFGVNYTSDDQAVDIHEYARVITAALIRECGQNRLNLPELVIEPGRSIVGPAGVTLYTAGMLKTIHGVVSYLMVDGGMADNIRPALYDAKYSAVVANKADQPATCKMTIAGKYCESGDILVRDVMLPEVQPGDVVALPVTGAYCLPMASNYNGAMKPAVIMVNQGSNRIIRRREEEADLVSLDIDQET